MSLKHIEELNKKRMKSKKRIVTGILILIIGIIALLLLSVSINIVASQDTKIENQLQDIDKQVSNLKDSIFSKNRAVAFKYGRGEKNELFIFTDPECQACENLEEIEGERLEAHKVNVMLFPINSHVRSKPIIQWILRANTDNGRHKRYKLALAGNEEWKKDINITSFEYTLYAEVLNMNLSDNLLTKEKKIELLSAKRRFFNNEKEYQGLKEYFKEVKEKFKEQGAKGTPTIIGKYKRKTAKELLQEEWEKSMDDFNTKMKDK